MSTLGMVVRLVVSLTVLVLIAWQSPVTIGICLFLAMLALQVAMVLRAYRALERLTGRSLDRAIRRLAIEVAAGVLVNAGVFFGSMWASAAYS